MNDFRNPDIWRGIIASTARWLIPLFFGLFGAELTSDQLGQAVAWVVGGVLFVMSILWSKSEKKKLLNKPAPPGTRKQ